MTNEEGEEAFDPTCLGEIEEVREERYGDQEFMIFEGIKGASSIIIRGANDHMVDEIERTLHDAICMLKRVLES
eukprot:CAMPEP_0201285662 /NCGR_PEP_ID=MMETSP1317-20130820/113633_1 /ASSEMBLY_ACC=CAM_ASM_000770 /TAXON_ID=187299 /ORGANISM="Undescribed Undescribed, Strain Undescribed" /LENGTH=73 /DNA_ID=CAMNT_0047611401 /DNA_START=895 /DNA_END=1116 /DNA_ORIENTATION=+